ncbi:MAG: histidine phosphatase family protein [Chloroflexi bacterium]|nr:histidine phosphatase family protein [Chloroflexota bacterium]
MVNGARAAGLIYLIRHCEAGSPPGPESALTERGRVQARNLGERLADLRIGRIVTSPYRRAIQTVEPLAERLGLEIETDERLVERRMPFDPDVNWIAHVRPTFFDLDLELTDAESSRVAMARGAAALSDIVTGGRFPVAVSAHGQILSLLLVHLDGRPGFATWTAMTLPDVFKVTVSRQGAEVERVWS